MIQDNFDLKQAFHAKEAAYEEMAAARDEMLQLRQQQNEKYEELQKLQERYDEEKAKDTEAWERYNSAQLELKSQIGQKIDTINECNLLEAQMRQETDAKVPEVYAAGAKYFATLAKQTMVERDKLISKKRLMARPENTAVHLLENLKTARREHNDILEEYHQAKNEFNLKKQKFDRLEAKYQAIKNPEAQDNTYDYSSRPKQLEVTEELILGAGVPANFMADATAEQRADGTIDIYYARALGDGHGHVVLNPEHVVIYHRQPVA